MSLSQKDVSRLENENDHLRQENERLMRKNRELEEKNRHLEEIMSQNMNSLPRYRNKVHIKLQHFFPSGTRYQIFFRSYDSTMTSNLDDLDDLEESRVDDNVSRGFAYSRIYSYI